MRTHIGKHDMGVCHNYTYGTPLAMVHKIAKTQSVETTRQQRRKEFGILF